MDYLKFTYHFVQMPKYQDFQSIGIQIKEILLYRTSAYFTGNSL